MRKFSLWKRFCLLCLGILSLNLLTGCGDNFTPTPAKSNGATSAAAKTAANPYPVDINSKIAALPPTEMTVYFADDYYNEPPIVDMLKEFQTAYPNIKIKVDSSKWENMRDKVKTAVNQGNPPDLAHYHAFVMGAQNYAEKLDDLWREAGVGLSAKFTPGALEDVTWGGSFYGMPLDINTVFLIYNKTMFKEAGLSEPDVNYTYTKLLEDAKKLTQPENNRYGVVINNGVWNMYGHLRSVGGRIIQEQSGASTTVQLSDEANVQMMNFASDLINKYKVAPMPPSGRFDPVELFMQRKTAMFFSGPWDLNIIQQKGPAGLYDEVGTATMPRGFDGKVSPGSVQGGGGLFVPKGAKNREAAFELMKWAVSPKYQMRLAKEMGRYPVLTDMYKDPFFTNQTILKPYLEMLRFSHPYELEAYAEADAAWEAAIKAILLQGQDARTTLETANRLIVAAVTKK